ncbi:MAG: hypothetical protein WA484_00785 [Solirubrobacteraceae bacterium]
MNSMLYIPPQIIAYVRDALHSVIGQAAERIANVADWSREEQCPVWYVEHLERLERVFALLEVLGWSEADCSSAIRIDLCEHRWALLKALEVLALDAQDDLDELDLGIKLSRTARLRRGGDALRRAFELRDFGSAAIVQVALLDAEEHRRQRWSNPSKAEGSR